MLNQTNNVNTAMFVEIGCCEKHPIAVITNTASELTNTIRKKVFIENILSSTEPF